MSQGSEAEIADEAVVATRAPYVLQLTRKRREFESLYKFADRDSHDGAPRPAPALPPPPGG